MPRFKDIERYIEDANYSTMVRLVDLEDQLDRWRENYRLDICPDFQRGHVWDESRQVAYVEHLLRGGRGSEVLRLNCPGWMGSFVGPMQLVDGLQRLTACRRFLADEIPAFGFRFSEYEDRPLRVDLLFSINTLPTRALVLRWYLELNSGGVVHTEEELLRVQRLLAAETR